MTTIISPVGIYHHIEWTSFNVAKLFGISEEVKTEIRPKSGSQAAVHSIVGDILSGSGAAVLSPVDYETFSLDSLCFASGIATVTSATSIDVPCKVAFRRFLPGHGNEDKSPVATKDFLPTTAVVQDMIEATFTESDKLDKT